MLPRRDHGDEGAVDVMAGVKRPWMRFFASLRMTAAEQLQRPYLAAHLGVVLRTPPPRLH